MSAYISIKFGVTRITEGEKVWFEQIKNMHGTVSKILNRLFLAECRWTKFLWTFLNYKGCKGKQRNTKEASEWLIWSGIIINKFVFCFDLTKVKYEGTRFVTQTTWDLYLWNKNNEISSYIQQHGVPLGVVGKFCYQLQRLGIPWSSKKNIVWNDIFAATSEIRTDPRCHVAIFFRSECQIW